MDTKLSRSVAFTQGAFYIVTGFWAVLNRRSFEIVTGPKGEFWLVRTVGLLIGLIGTVLTVAGVRRRTLEPEIGLLAAGTALSLASIDVIYWRRGRLLPIYLVDAGGEVMFIGAWFMAWLVKRQLQ